MPTQTTNYGLNKPLVNSATDQDLWGGQLNGDLDELDGLLLTAIDWTPNTQTTSFNVTAPTAASSATGSSNTLYLCNCTSGAITATLPAATTCSGMKVSFKKSDATTNSVTIQGHSAETIDGSNTFIISPQYGYLTIASDGTEWNILSQTAPQATKPVQNFQAFASTGSNTFTAPAGTTSLTAFKFTLTGAGAAGGGATAISGGSGGGLVRPLFI